MATIFKKVDEYKELLDRKDQLEQDTKDNNKAIEQCKKELSQMMVDEECPKVSRNGFLYSLQEKTNYSKKAEETLQEAGIDFFDVLRNEGLGDIIKETVNPRTLSSTMGAYIEEHGELSEELAECISIYEQLDVTKRKETNKVASKAKNKEEA